MFNAINLESGTDWELNKKYQKAVNLAINICQESDEQFKLVETPLKSFVLISNVLPDDNRPWEEQNTDTFDFSSISLINDKLPTSGLDFLNKTKIKISLPTQSVHDGYCYATYGYEDVIKSLQLNKNTIIGDIIELMSNPITWTSVVPQDPLPWLWLLFYGNLSMCGEVNCVYKRYFINPGPILYPAHIYNPKMDINTSIKHICSYVVSLYGEVECLETSFSDDMTLPFTVDRLNKIKQQFSLVGCMSHVTRRCLLCCIYKQNICASKRASLSKLETFILLTGKCEQFLTNSIGNIRDLQTGNNILFPTYNIEKIVEDLRSNE